MDTDTSKQNRLCTADISDQVMACQRNILDLIKN